MNLSPRLTLFLASLVVTLSFWILRGLGILTFVKGLVLWVLLFFTLVVGILATIRPRRSS